MKTTSEGVGDEVAEAIGDGAGFGAINFPLSHFSFFETLTHLNNRPFETVVAPAFLHDVPAIEVDADENEGVKSKAKRVAVVTATLFVSILKG